MNPERPVAPSTRIGHVHLKVADLQRALGFYRDVLGFEVTQRSTARDLLSAPAVCIRSRTPIDRTTTSNQRHGRAEDDQRRAEEAPPGLYGSSRRETVRWSALRVTAPAGHARTVKGGSATTR